MGRDLVGLDGAALLACKVLQQPARDIERLVDGDTRVAVDALDLGILAIGPLLDVCGLHHFFLGELRESGFRMRKRKEDASPILESSTVDCRRPALDSH